MPKLPVPIRVKPGKYDVSDEIDQSWGPTYDKPHRVQAPHLYIGIDPGVSGGLVAIYSSGKIEATPMPSSETDIWFWFANLPDLPYQLHGMVEKVGGYIGGDEQAKGSRMFTFGQNCGCVRMGLIAKRVPFEEVRPQAWQKAFGIAKRKNEPKPKWKDRLLALAQQMYPKFDWPRLKKDRLAIADALLIATYCQRKQEGKL